MEVTMKSGFMEFVATRLVPDHPGQTERWYAKEYLQLGSNLSDAKNPEESLANTLAKQVREGREPRIKRIRKGGKYLYFPASMTYIPDTGVEVIIQLSLSEQELKNIENLVSVGKFNNRDNAIKWLLQEGIKANNNYLDKVANTIRQIESLKKEVIN
jgi:Arc/MetJ-type ribon-helix-helix transcriptional regulator